MHRAYDKRLPITKAKLEDLIESYKIMDRSEWLNKHGCHHKTIDPESEEQEPDIPVVRRSGRERVTTEREDFDY